MNNNSYPYAEHENPLEIPIQNYRNDDLSSSPNTIELKQEVLEQIDEEDISRTNAVNVVEPSPDPSSTKYLKIFFFLKRLRKFLKRQASNILKMDFAKYVILNVSFLILMKYGIISNYCFLFIWGCLSLWLIAYKITQLVQQQTNPFIHILENNSRQRHMINSFDNNENQGNANQSNSESNTDVIRRRDAENLVAFHPLRFHMIVGRLHNILNQLRENQMIINAAVMGNRGGGHFNFREFQDFLINGLNRNNVPQNNGFTEQEIENLPQYVYERHQTPTDEKKTEDEEQCSICLMEFQNNEVIRTLPCIHNFHKDCIDQWLKRQKYCPLCKGEIVFN